jgi:hypothetical protein
MIPSVRAFAPSLGPLISSLAHRPWVELQGDPPELARIALQALQVAGGTHLTCPIDQRAVTAACGSGAAVVDDELDLSAATFGDLDDLEPDEVLASPWIRPMLELARIAGGQARVPLAARLPSPLRLVAELGANPDVPDALLAAGDVCSAVALALLRAGASIVLVDPAPGRANDDSIGMLVRTAAPFDVPVIDTESPRVRWIRLPPRGGAKLPGGANLPGAEGNGSPVASGEPSTGREETAVLITSRPVRQGDDLGRLRELAMAAAS